MNFRSLKSKDFLKGLIQPKQRIESRGMRKDGGFHYLVQGKPK